MFWGTHVLHGRYLCLIWADVSWMNLLISQMVITSTDQAIKSMVRLPVRKHCPSFITSEHLCGRCDSLHNSTSIQAFSNISFHRTHIGELETFLRCHRGSGSGFGFHQSDAHLELRIQNRLKQRERQWRAGTHSADMAPEEWLDIGVSSSGSSIWTSRLWLRWCDAAPSSWQSDFKTL